MKNKIKSIVGSLAPTLGAALGGPLSGAGSNAQVNATGLAGIDPVLGNKKIKRRKDLRKILDR